jgi:hypothetical protein
MEADGGAGAEGDNLCTLCPTTDEQRTTVPEPPELEGAPMSNLRCGHQVHTHCLINQLYLVRRNAACADCGANIMRDEAVEFYREMYYNDRDTVRETVANLWANNEEFRNDVKEYKKLSGKLLKIQRVYSRELKVIKNRFKENVLTSVAVINDQKRQAIADLKALESRKLYKRAGSAATRKLVYFRRKWDVTSWGLRGLNDIQGAPKITRGIIYSRWGSSPKYIFRLKL